METEYPRCKCGLYETKLSGRPLNVFCHGGNYISQHSVNSCATLKILSVTVKEPNNGV